jgi:hypothetical protein
VTLTPHVLAARAGEQANDSDDAQEATQDDKEACAWTAPAHWNSSPAAGRRYGLSSVAGAAGGPRLSACLRLVGGHRLAWRVASPGRGERKLGM